MITGKTLIDMGYSPAPWFGEVIKEAKGKTLTEKELNDLIKKASADKTIKPFDSPVAYHKNIRAENKDEQENVDKVFETMEELMKTPTVVKGAVMPDACPTGELGQIPVGGVVATRNAIHPSMHSADICCSVMMTNLGPADPEEVLDAAHQMTHFGPGGREEYCELPIELEERILNNPFLNSEKSLMYAKTHLATQGDGNHFLFVGKTKNMGDTTIVTHHGSRGFGALLYKEGMKVAENFRKKISPKTLKRNAWIPFDTQEGQDYWEALQIVREWTKLNHTLIHKETARISGATEMYNFWNEHNFVFKDDDLFYHAKGATPLLDKFVPDSNGLRLIPLNMSQPVLIVKGDESDNNLGFAPHGAGRNISRAEHKRRNEDRTDEEIFIEETKGLDVRFHCGLPDISELPSAYKDANNVQDQMKEFGLGNVIDQVIPYGCIMAGDWHTNAPWRNKKKDKE